MEDLVATMNSQQAFWLDKTVLITGHTGFKGAWLSLWLQQLGSQVIGFSLPPVNNNDLFNLANVQLQMVSHIADIREYTAIYEIINKYRPEIIIHMAAQPLVRYAYKAPLETYGINVMGTANLLEAARTIGSVKAIVNVTTDKCYENKEWCWGYRETDNLGGLDPYSNSKACSELITLAYRSAYFNSTPMRNIVRPLQLQEQVML